MNAAVQGVALNFDATNVQVEDRMEAIPAGWYNVTVTGTERKPSSQKPQNHYMEVVHTIMDGPYAGRKLFNRINLWNDDATAMEIAYKGAAGIAALQQAVGVFNCQTSTQLHGIPLKVKVKLRPAGPGKDGKHYDASNDVVKYANINADVGDDAGANAGGVPSFATGAGAALPWAGAGAPAPQAFPQPAAAPMPQAQFAPAAPAAPAPMPQAAPQPWPQPGAVAAPAAPAIPAGAPAWVAAGATAAPAPAAPPAPQAPAPQAPPPGPIMLPAANGIPYESYRQQGWTDEALIAHGFMAPPAAPSAPPAQDAMPPAGAAPAGARPPWAT